MNKWWLVLASLGIGGTAMAAVPGGAQLVAGAMSGSAGLNAAAAPGATSVPATTAESLAVKAVGGGQVTGLIRNHFAGQAVYTVHVRYQGRTFEVKVSLSGQVLQKVPETSTDASQAEKVAVSTSTVSVPAQASAGAGATLGASAGAAAQAVKAALAAVGGGQAVSVRAEGESGHWVVTVSDAGQLFVVKLDARGNILTLKGALKGDGEAKAGVAAAGDGQDGLQVASNAGAAVSALPPGLSANTGAGLSARAPGLLQARVHARMQADGKGDGKGLDLKGLLKLGAGAGN